MSRTGGIGSNIPMKTAFGESAVASVTPIFQSDFSYNINSELWTTKANNGTVSLDLNRARMSTGAGANQSAILQSKIPIKYSPGQGGLVRFTSVFTTGVPNSTQILGIGNSSAGFFFGYNGEDFGILRRKDGANEARTFAVTTGSSTAENISVTLDGVSTGAVVPVTASGDTTITANEIANFDYSNIGGGWETTVEGSNVLFISFDSSVKSGAFSITATTAAVSISQEIAGVVPTDIWISQDNFSEDKCDGSGAFPVIDWTKGNIFQIQYQWLGYGQIAFFLENPKTGAFTMVHRIKYANTSEFTSIDNPTGPLYLSVINDSNSSDVVMMCPSFGGFIEGALIPGIVKFSESATKNLSTEAPVLSLHVKKIFHGRENQVKAKLTIISFASDGTKSSVIKTHKNATLVGADFNDVDTENSVVSFDSSATSLSGGKSDIVIGLAKVDSVTISVTDVSIVILPGETITISGQSDGASDISVSLSWEELL